MTHHRRLRWKNYPDSITRRNMVGKSNYKKVGRNDAINVKNKVINKTNEFINTKDTLQSLINPQGINRRKVRREAHKVSKERSIQDWTSQGQDGYVTLQGKRSRLDHRNYIVHRGEEQQKERMVEEDDQADRSWWQFCNYH